MAVKFLLRGINKLYYDKKTNKEEFIMKKLIKKIDSLVIIEIGLILLAGIWYLLGIHEFIPKSSIEWTLEILLGVLAIEMIRKGIL
jgi:hypothetical protein